MRHIHLLVGVAMGALMAGGCGPSRNYISLHSEVLEVSTTASAGTPNSTAHALVLAESGSTYQDPAVGRNDTDIRTGAFCSTTSGITSPLPSTKQDSIEPKSGPGAAVIRETAFKVPSNGNLPGSIRILYPHSGARVSQYGERVQFHVSNPLPVGVMPVVYTRDATGGDCNWWFQGVAVETFSRSQPEPSHSGSSTPSITNRCGVDYECKVQFGEAVDSGRAFAVQICLLDAATSAIPVVGPLPSHTQAHSERIDVIRD